MLPPLHLCWAVARRLSCPLFKDAKGQLLNINDDDGGGRSRINQGLGVLKRQVCFKKTDLEKKKTSQKNAGERKTMETVYKRPPGTLWVPGCDSTHCLC